MEKDTAKGQATGKGPMTKRTDNPQEGIITVALKDKGVRPTHGSVFAMLRRTGPSLRLELPFKYIAYDESHYPFGSVSVAVI